MTIQTMSLTPVNAIQVEVRQIYGTTKVYPLCETAKAFARIAGTTTLTIDALRNIERIGFEIISQANADWRKGK